MMAFDMSQTPPERPEYTWDTVDAVARRLQQTLGRPVTHQEYFAVAERLGVSE